jgi:hypothetical protein
MTGISLALPATPTPCYLVSIAATTLLAAGLWLRFLTSR